MAGRNVKCLIPGTGRIFRHMGMQKVSFQGVQSSEPLHTKINPTSCLLGSRFVWNPFFLLAGTLLFDEKIPHIADLFWYGLRFVGFLQIFFSQDVTQRTIVDFPAFLATRKKIAICGHTTRDPNR